MRIPVGIGLADLFRLWTTEEDICDDINGVTDIDDFVVISVATELAATDSQGPYKYSAIIIRRRGR